MGRRKVRFVDCDGVKVSPRFLEAAAAEPGTAIGFDPAVPHMQDYPWLFDEEGPVKPLHICVYDFYKAGLRPRKPGEIIHHRDGDKWNCTIENLGIGLPSAHGLAHALKKQRFTPRKRWKLAGLYRPRREAPVKQLGFVEEMAYRRELLEREENRRENERRIREALESSRALTGERCKKLNQEPPTSPPVLGLVTQRKMAEKHLRGMLPALRAEIDPLDSGEKIPFTSTRPKRRDRLLGLVKIRRGCTPGEAALVRLLVKHKFDRIKAAQEAHLDRRIIDELAREPAVSLAVERWLTYRRLPRPNPHSKLKPFRTRP